MLVYWNAGQDGFWDPAYDGAGLDLASPLGFEPLIASDPYSLRTDVLNSLIPSEPALWLDPDPGVGPLTPAFASVEEARDAVNGLVKPRPSVSRVAVVRLQDPDWIAVVFRGTTPSPLRGLLREGQVNSMAGQEEWEEAPEVLRGGSSDDDDGSSDDGSSDDGSSDARGQHSRVHRGYAAAYRTVLAEVEGAVTAHARAALATRSELKSSTPPPKVVVVGHSLGGALAALCASRLAHDKDVAALGGGVECVTFGQPRVGDGTWAKHVDERTPRLTYTRVVKAGDLFARVPTSGFWLPSGNGGRFGVDYAHAGALVWTTRDDDGVRAFVQRGAGEPDGFGTDARMVNPISVARDHAGYAYFFEKEELRRRWPSKEELFGPVGGAQ
jgi:pimeloyl-ACP methyl ester carboxylesterase